MSENKNRILRKAKYVVKAILVVKDTQAGEQLHVLLTIQIQDWSKKDPKLKGPLTDGAVG